MAEVFLAQRIGAEGFARNVAIKTILAVGAEEEGIGLFLDEAKVASYLEHAAIVQTVDLGFENETLFIVMEYVPGPSLSRIIRDLKKGERFISPRIVAYIGARVASALDYAWSRATTPDGTLLRLVHRDISPQNIMITRTGNVKLTDFGVARASVQTHKTRTGQVRGKAAYMAPEQVRAGKLDGRTDIFALALVLYEALTGVRAFQRKTDIMSMRAILTDEMAAIRDVNPAVPDDLIAVVKRAAAKKPEDRFSTAAELGEALQRTYRAYSEAAIESEMVELINELFGEEQFSSDSSAVEAWQPTITAQAEGGDGSYPTPHRISGSKLSPKIAALLNPTPASSPSIETPSQPFDEDFEISVASIVSTSGVQEPSLPGTPVMGGTPSVPFNELMPGTKSVFAPVPQTLLSYPNRTGVVPTPAPQPSRAWIWAVCGFGIALCAGFAIIVLSGDRGARTAERTSPEASGQGPVGVGVVSRDPPRMEIERPSVEPVEPSPPQETPDGEERRRPRPKKPREEVVVPPEQPAQPKEEPPQVDKVDKNKEVEGFVLRAIAAKKKIAADEALKKDMTKLINDLTIAPRDLTQADWALLKRAEAL